MILNLSSSQRTSLFLLQWHTWKSAIQITVSLLGFLPFLLHADQEGDFTYSIKDKEVTITGYTGKGGPVAIPEKIAGLPVRTIAKSHTKAPVSSVRIPSSIVKIDADLLWYDIEAFTVDPANPTFTSIDGVLFDKKGTTLIHFPKGKAGIYSVPKGTIKIEKRAFSICPKLTRVIIPPGLGTIEPLTFYLCGRLESVTLPSGLTTISATAFRDCVALTSVTFPDSLTSIEQLAFAGCEKLSTITLPPNLNKIERDAFSVCKSLASAIFQGNAPPEMSKESVFNHTAPNFTIRYYKGATGFTTPEWHGYKTVEVDPTTELFDWTSNDGKILEAKFQKLDGEVVVVRTDDGKEHKIPFNRLSPASVAQAKMFGGAN